MADSLSRLITEAIDFCREEFERRWDDRYSYHNFAHTQEVFSNTIEIGEAEKLSMSDRELAQLAALFHDHGHLDGQTDHELRSAEIASTFLTHRAVRQELIDQVTQAIAATKVPQQPSNLISKVVCDADLKYLATEDFFIKAERLRQEWWKTGRTHMQPVNFFTISLDFLQTHSYHTHYGKTILTPGKEKNMALLENMLRNGSI